MELTCDNCGKKFQRKPSKKHRLNYCSRKCMYEHRRKMGIAKAKRCINCEAPIRKGRKFCSLSCYFRYMWKTTWKHKRTNKWEPSKRNFATIIVRVPQPGLTDFELELRQLIKNVNRVHGPLRGKAVMHIIGERRLRASYDETRFFGTV